MKVIKFPGAGKYKKSIQGLTIEKVDTSQHSPLHGPWDFTCVDCGHITHFNTSGMIFKMLEFFCVGCGSFFKVTNPAFKSKPTRQPVPIKIIKRNN